MGLEFELKYAAKPEVLQAIARDFGEFTSISMETTYYDTTDFTLSDQKMTLRRRFENGLSVCTLKTPSQSYGRGEWDLQEPWSETAANQLFAMANVTSVPFADLKAVCGAKFTRLAKTVRLPDCVVEIALDNGILFGKDAQIPLCEVEVELKEGDQDAVIRWAQAFAKLYGLTAESRSKFKRALSLAKGE